MKTLEELLEMLYLTDDISQIRQQIINKIDLLEDVLYVKSVAGHLLLKFENFIHSINLDEKNNTILVIINVLKQIKATGIIEVNSLKEYLYSNRFCINFWFVLVTESLYKNIYPTPENKLQHNALVNELNTRLFKLLELTKQVENSSLEEILKLITDSNSDDYSYSMLFAYTLRQTSIKEINNFLNHHRTLSENKDFEIFVEEMMLDYETIFLEKTKKKIEKWLSQKNKLPERKPLLTEQQRALAFYYILSDLGVRACEIDKSDIARLITVLSNSSYQHIYKKVKNIYSTKVDIRIEDYEAILPYFNNLKIETIAEKIREKINN